MRLIVSWYIEFKVRFRKNIYPPLEIRELALENEQLGLNNTLENQKLSSKYM